NPLQPSRSCSTPCTPSSSTYILRLVRSGQDVPGLHRPNVTASLASPTPSRLARRPKPWERARPAEPPPLHLTRPAPRPGTRPRRPTRPAPRLQWGVAMAVTRYSPETAVRTANLLSLTADNWV
uniref:Peroxisomal membrane protein PEX14-like KPWE domain-containing protein n=1 Tax=Chrysemys picta bellii TaxID=8478 RepID=A0A8C3F982_CHRPI